MPFFAHTVGLITMLKYKSLVQQTTSSRRRMPPPSRKRASVSLELESLALNADGSSDEELELDLTTEVKT